MRFVVVPLFWLFVFPLVLAGLALRGLYEGTRFGWRMPEIVQAKRAVSMVAQALSEMER